MILSKKILLKNNIDLIDDAEVFKQVNLLEENENKVNYKDYFVSNYGRLIHKTPKGNYRIMQPYKVKNYNAYNLATGKTTTKNGKVKRIVTPITAHRLTAFMFVENPYKDKYDYSIKNLDTHHKDHNKQNNYCNNLMWLSNGKNGTRTDHQFIDSIQKIAVYNKDSNRYHTYKDIERLCKRIDIDILELIDILRDKTTPHFKNDKWITYKVYDYCIGIQYFKKKVRKPKSIYNRGASLFKNTKKR